MVRYADDFVIACRPRTRPTGFLGENQEMARGQKELKLNEAKTRVVGHPPGRESTFLGFNLNVAGKSI